MIVVQVHHIYLCTYIRVSYWSRVLIQIEDIGCICTRHLYNYVLIHMLDIGRMKLYKSRIIVVHVHDIYLGTYAHVRHWSNVPIQIEDVGRICTRR